MTGPLLRVRLFVVLARPPLLLLLAMSGALGASAAGAALDPVPALRAFLVVVPCLVYAVSLNDVVDVHVDRINLPADPSRPLVAGAGRARDMLVVAFVSAGAALLLATWVGSTALSVTALGLLVATAYSVPPVALNRRGMLGPLLLPLCLLAVPFAVGVDAAGGRLDVRGLALLGALYAGFIGRLLVKDFRDVSGDALLGKRTFLVRRGRAVTCGVSAGLWVAGSVALLVVPSVSWPLVLCWTALLAVALVVLARLARPSDHRRDERLVAALAVTGRALVIVLLLHFGLVEQGADELRTALLLLSVTVALGLSAAHVAVHGPRAGGAVLAAPSGSRSEAV